MKKFLSFILSLLLLNVSTSHVFAQTATPKQSVTEALSDQITNLKEKIASRVAELDLVDKKGIVGTASEVEDTQITLTDIYGKPRIIDVDELTNFSSPDEDDSFGISDIQPGTKISILGLYNKETERLLARYVSVVSIPTYIVGEISEIDEDEFTASVTGFDNVAYTIDIETSTNIQSYVDEDLEKAGFSDLEVGQKVFVTGFEDEDDPSLINTSRVLIYSDEFTDTQQKTPSPASDDKE